MDAASFTIEGRRNEWPIQSKSHGGAGASFTSLKGRQKEKKVVVLLVSALGSTCKANEVI